MEVLEREMEAQTDQELEPVMQWVIPTRLDTA